jgi:hypothetical protein
MNARAGSRCVQRVLKYRRLHSKKKTPNAIGKGAEREMNTLKFWHEPALMNVNTINTVPLKCIV